MKNGYFAFLAPVGG